MKKYILLIVIAGLFTGYVNGQSFRQGIKVGSASQPKTIIFNGDTLNKLIDDPEPSTESILLWDSDSNKWVAAELVDVTDSILTIQFVAVSITSANLDNGDSLNIVSAPGANRAIIPVKCAIKYTYATSTYTSADATHSAVISYEGGATEIYEIADDMFESATSLYKTSIPIANTFISESMGSTGTVLENKAVRIYLDNHSGTGTGNASLYLWYIIN